MKNRVKVSIIVPIYNIEKYLEKCIKSLIFQTYNNTINEQVRDFA